jgi:hypothetical protein
MSYRSIIIIVLAILLFTPFPTVIVPKWGLRVFDVNRNVCANKEVTQTWAHYSIYIVGDFQSEHRRTNGEGYVEFPERKIWAPIILRVVSAVIANIMTVAHGSTGPDASVYTHGLKDKAWIDYETSGLVDNMVAEKCFYEGLP